MTNVVKKRKHLPRAVRLAQVRYEMLREFHDERVQGVRLAHNQVAIVQLGRRNRFVIQKAVQRNVRQLVVFIDSVAAASFSAIALDGVQQ